jgi:hypothetical protein
MIDPKLAGWLALVTIFFMGGGVALIITGHDITAYMGLLPVMASQLLLLTRVHKVEKNTNGNMTKLIDAALNNNKKDTTNEQDPQN